MEKIIPKKWGCEKILAVTDDYIMKILNIEKGKSISLQYHVMKDETWYIAKGKGMVVKGDESFGVTIGDVVHLPAGTIHRVTAVDEMVIIEASSTVYVDDIVRLKED